MKVIITGTTGMIGEGILLECLNKSEIKEVLSVSRKGSGKSHPKLKEYLVPDFLSLQANDENLSGYDACFFCAGVSSVGMSKEVYEKNTYDTTLQFANALNPNPNLTFIYVSGSGTDSSEKGSIHWARVKGKTENDLMKLAFKNVFGFRIGIVIPKDGQDHVLKYYKKLSWLLPVIKILFSSFINTMDQVAKAMIYLSKNGYDHHIIHIKDIKRIDSLK